MLKFIKFIEWFSTLCEKSDCITCGHQTEHDDQDAYFQTEYDFNGATVLGIDDMRQKTAASASATISSKDQLISSIVGFFSLCVEFKSDFFGKFATNFGVGRSFYRKFIYGNDKNWNRCLVSLVRFLNLDVERQDRYILYDNDHLNPVVLKTFGLRNSKSVSAFLEDAEFTELVTVATYLHDTTNLPSRVESVAALMVSDPAKGEMVKKIMKWIIHFYVTPDVRKYNSQYPISFDERVKWQNARNFVM